MKNTALLIFLFLGIISCKDKPQLNPGDEKNVVEIPEEFVTFYERFHTDSTFQMNHIVFPLSQRADSTKWTKEEWVMHQPFDNQSGSFTRTLDNFEGIIIETIREKNNSVIIQRRFSKIGGEYHLIYYSIQNRMEGWAIK